MGKNMKVSVFLVNAPWAVISGEGNFNDQVDRMTHSVSISQPLSLAAPICSQWTHDQSGRGGKEVGLSSATWPSTQQS